MCHIDFVDDPARGDMRYRRDPRRTGVLTGRGHYTFDMELFGPSGWLQGIYLGALKAAAHMADAVGESGFASECRDVFERGRSWTEQHLFNGSYHEQSIDLGDDNILEGVECARELYWDEEHREIKYQMGEGCAIDSHLGLLFATLCGLGDVLAPSHVRSTANAIFENNFVASARTVTNPWRNFALNDEALTLMCTWPKGRRKPIIPVPYNSECMTGFEWAFATHLVLVGELGKAERVATAIRDWFDGAKRNPFNEMGCGSNYARSMAAFGLFQAYGVAHRDPKTGSISFPPPAVSRPFRGF